MKTEEKKSGIPNSVSRAIFVRISILLQVYWIISFMSKLTEYSALAQFLINVFALAVVMRVYSRRTNSAYKILWIIILLLVPVFGLTLFFLLNFSAFIGQMRKRFVRTDQRLGVVLPTDERVLGELKSEDIMKGNQAHYLQKCAGFPIYRGTNITYFGDTYEAFKAQKEALLSARKFIFMEYHAIEDSTSWRQIEGILAQKVSEGVEVRVFYDDMGSIGFISGAFDRRLRSEGIKCRVFNPIVPIFNVFMNNRDHRKITVVDGRIGFTGGYNLADEYFNITHPYGVWKDSGIRLEGAAVRSLTVIFLEMWGATQRTPDDFSRFLVKSENYPEAKGYAAPYADSPLDNENTGENVYLNIIKSAKHYVYMTTPYLIISDEMQRELTLAAGRGVDIRIVTPGIPDKKLVYGITRSYYRALTSKGVRIYEYTPGFIHSKQFVADGEVAAVGTINMDFRSLYLHFENGCWFCDCAAVEDIRRDFDYLFSVSRDVTEKSKIKPKVCVRIYQCILRLFSPLL